MKETNNKNISFIKPQNREKSGVKIFDLDFSDLPEASNSFLENALKLLGNPKEKGQSAAKQEVDNIYYNVVLEYDESGNAFKRLIQDPHYWIYPDGRLRSFKRSKDGRWVKGSIDNVGYREYYLAIQHPTCNKKQKREYAHRLVALYFIDNPENKAFVNHMDENKSNNNVDNLEWVTPSENSKKYIENNPKKSRSKAKYHDWNLEGEEWKIISFSPAYSVSNKGRIKNNRTNRLLRTNNHLKYSRVCLGENRTHHYVHRLVYCVFTDDWNLDGFVINHIDGNPKNNHLENLQKITPTESNLQKTKNKTS